MPEGSGKTVKFAKVDSAKSADGKSDVDTKAAEAPQKKVPVVLLPKRILLPKYMPFDVATWGQGGWAILGWQTCAWVAFLSGGLFALYEMIIINRFDRDCRDLYMDNRLLEASTNYYHKYFINAELCCNTDHVVFNYTCVNDLGNEFSYSMSTPPLCPPKIIMQCTGLTSAPCNATRAALYEATGLSPAGVYQDCLRVGQVLVGSENLQGGGPLVLVAEYNGQRFGPTFAVPQPFNISQTALNTYVQLIANTYPDPNRVQPNNPLSRSFKIPGTIVNLTMPGPVVWRNALKLINPWLLWPWPGFNNRCPNSHINSQYYLYGKNSIFAPDYNYSNAAGMILNMQFMNQTIRVPAYQLVPLDTGDTAQASNLDVVQLNFVSIVTLLVGQVPTLGACYGWLASQADLNVTYRPLLTTDMSVLLNTTIPAPVNQSITLFVYDMAGPQYVALPEYEGVWLLVFGIGCGGFWLFALIFFILIPMPLIWWNVRKNQGLPPIVYRYMQRYRGW